MRIRTLLCLAALTAGVATTMAQSNVYSLNIVGYVTKTNSPGYQIISNPLNATNNSLSSLYPNAPDFTTVYRFQGGAYVQSTFDPDQPGWTANFTFNPGEGYFMNVGSQYVVTYVGEVVLNSTNPIPSGYSMRASALPQAGRLTADLLYPPNDFDTAYRFVNNAYVQFTYDPDAPGWTPSDPNIAVGEGFFLNTGTAKNWIRNFSVGP
jgi:hypothetical protein